MSKMININITNGNNNNSKFNKNNYDKRSEETKPRKENNETETMTIPNNTKSKLEKKLLDHYVNKVYEIVDKKAEQTVNNVVEEAHNMDFSDESNNEEQEQK